MKWTMICLTFLCGCASDNVLRAPDIQVAEAQAVTTCAYLDMVYGASGWYGVFTEKGLTNARASAFNKAKTLGATHLVWQPAASSYGTTQVAAKAYRCPGQ